MSDSVLLVAVVALFGVLPSSIAHAQTTPAEQLDGPQALENRAAVDVYTAPKSKDLVAPVYPELSLRRLAEGWVRTHFMVDTAGKPYEIMVTDSTGDRTFRGAAIRALKASTFEPAALNGKPLDAGATRKYIFDIEGSAGPSTKFVRTHRRLVEAIGEDSRERADAELAAIDEFRRLNFYEDAMLHLAKYNYYLKWGDDRQRLAALDRAIAYEDTPRFLRSASFRAALLARFDLLVKTRDFARALRTAEQLEELGDEEGGGLGPQRLEALGKAVDRIEAFREDDRAYSVPGEIDDSAHWAFNLFRDDFEIGQIDGEIAELKLRCERAYVFFRFDPNIRYHIADEQGGCHLTVVGNPGTTFRLTQM